MKKIIALFVSVAMLVSVFPLTGIAADVYYEKNYNTTDMTGGIGGKSADDKSCNTNQDYYEIIPLSDVVTVEFSLFHTTDYMNMLSFVYSTPAGANKFTNIFDTNGSGKLKFRPNNTVYTISDNRWIRIALQYNPKAESDNITLFINGEQKATSTIALPALASTKLRLVYKLSKDYIDDVIAYYGAYSAPVAPSISGKNGAVTGTSSLIVPHDTTVSAVADKLTVTNGSFAGVVDSETHLTKTDGELKAGDLAAVLLSDGYSFKYYSIEIQDAPFTKDFTNTTENVVSGIGGKAYDDNSYTAKADYYEIIPLSAKVTLEYNLWNSNSDYHNHLMFVFKDTTGNTAYSKILSTRSNGTILFEPTAKYYTIASNRWIRMAVTYDPALAENNLTWYMNGIETATGTITQPQNSSTKLRITFDQSKNHVDDIVVHYGDYTPPATPVLTASNGASVTNSTISFPAGVSASAIGEYVAVENGSVLGVADSETFKTKTEGNIKNGDLIAIAANDGVTYTYYTAKVLETKSFSNDFTNIKASVDDSWPKQPSGIEYLCPGYAATGIGGKSADDVCVDLRKENAYYRLDTTLYGISTIEYSVFKKNTTNCFVGPNGENRWLLFGHSEMIFDSGSVVQENENIVGSYKVGQWNRAAIEVNFNTGTFNAYVNGEKIITDKTLPSQLVEGTIMKLYFVGYCYLDDVKVYSGAYQGGTAPTLESGEDYTVKADSKFIVTENTFAVADAKDIFGENAVVSDSETFVTKTEGNIEVGDFVSLVSDDGLIRTYYTVISPDSISDIEILKDGEVYTAVTAVAGTYSAKVHVCESDSAAYTLYIAKYNGNKLTGVEFVNISNGSNRYIDADYTTSEVTVADGENIKAFLWNKADLSPIKKREIPVF